MKRQRLGYAAELVYCDAGLAVEITKNLSVPSFKRLVSEIHDQFYTIVDFTVK